MILKVSGVKQKFTLADLEMLVCKTQIVKFFICKLKVKPVNVKEKWRISAEKAPFFTGKMRILRRWRMMIEHDLCKVIKLKIGN